MIIEKGDTFTGIDTKTRLSFVFDCEKLSVDKFELMHIHLTVDRLEQLVDVSTFCVDD